MLLYKNLTRWWMTIKSIKICKRPSTLCWWRQNLTLSWFRAIFEDFNSEECLNVAAVLYLFAKICNDAILLAPSIGGLRGGMGAHPPPKISKVRYFGTKCRLISGSFESNFRKISLDCYRLPSNLIKLIYISVFK